VTIVTARPPRKRPKAAQPAEINAPRIVQHLPAFTQNLASPIPGDHHSARLGRSRTTFAGIGDCGFHPAIDLTHSRALALSEMPGNRRRNSMAADSSPSCSKAARIAAASASVTRNIA
jgi:hypothetical protein